MKAGRSLAEVKAAQPAKGYMGRYGNPGGAWTTDRFIEAVYRSLRKGKWKVESASQTLMRVLLTSTLVVLLAHAAVAQGPPGRGGPPAPPKSARDSAPIDLTGYWVSYVTENWRYRMVTPAKGEYRRIPSSPAALPLINAWDPAADERAGNQCKSYGAGNIMSVPGRLHITWQDADTLRIETDAGTQTRLFRFAPAHATSSPGPAAGRVNPQRRGNPRPAAAACASSRRTCAPATCGRTACRTASARR